MIEREMVPAVMRLVEAIERVWLVLQAREYLRRETDALFAVVFDRSTHPRVGLIFPNGPVYVSRYASKHTPTMTYPESSMHRLNTVLRVERP